MLRVLLIGRHALGARSIGALLTSGDVKVPPFERIEFARAETLAAAEALLTKEPQPQLVLTDLALPDGHGLETFQRLQEVAAGAAIIVISEYEDDETAYQAVQLGAQDSLVEGEVDATVLSRSIRHALARFAYDDEYRHSHESFQATLDASTLPSVVADAEGRVLYSNQAALEVLGVSPGRVDWQGRNDDPPRIAFDSAPTSPLQARVTDTLWDGRVALLITLELHPSSEGVLDGVAIDESRPASLFEGLISASPRMRSLFGVCERVAHTAATILIQGETGTGKELIARAIHKRSLRKGRFVAIDCGAIPEALIDSELFGHERGAFTGANARKLGLFRHAHQGTLLLDEISNMPLTSQHSLLRVLQEGIVRPLGGTDEFTVDVRIIAASSTDLHEAVTKRRFREDLLYRLDVIRLELLPLRERPEDVLHLLRLFVQQRSDRYDLESVSLGPGFLEAAANYPWPGNVRQLENFAERLLLTSAACRSKRDFHDVVRLFSPSETSSRPASRAPSVARSLSAFLDEQEEAYLTSLLRETHGSLQATADRAEIDPRTLRRKLKRHGIDRTRFLH